ncbi:MAG: hypothetical protein KBS63_06290 [Clostridiales bacterium]|nr:hypothetical protein [Candidatus Crickella caballi]
MTEKILVIDLEKKTFETREHPYNKQSAYGRRLVLDLIKEYVPDDAERYSKENVIVISPGFFAGNKAPSACRMFIATAEDRGKGIQICNTTGNLPQKIGSLGIAAIVIKGNSPEKSTVIHITENGVDFSVRPEYIGADVKDIVHGLKAEYGSNVGIMGTGKCGDMRMALSVVFLTYPHGTPEYQSPRSGFGDVFGAKNIRAIVVEGNDCFARENNAPEEFWALSKQLTQKIIHDEVCGGALPTYGSITIMKILKSRRSLAELSVMNAGKEALHKDPSGENVSDDDSRNRLRSNRTCAPMCAIGCLNRHTSNDGRKYESPSQVEVEAAVKNCFGIDDYDLSKEIQDRATEMGLVSVEYVTAAKAYAEAVGIEHGEENLLEWLDEIEQGTPIGRIIASRTYGIRNLFSDKVAESLVDRRAIQDESLFEVQVDSRYLKLKDMSTMELLYSQIFVLENLGFCIFTAFALLDNDETFEILARMFSAKTGIDITGEELIIQANGCIKAEKEYEEKRWRAALETNIPPFTKVLYRYFDSNRAEQK